MTVIAEARTRDPSPGHLVGREGELDSLERMLDELGRGRPGAIELAGEPGIGKTRLLRELAARAEARGHLVLSGAAAEFERDLPFSVFVDALDQYVAGLEPKRLAGLDDQVQAELAHVFPSLWALAGGREVAPQQERYPQPPRGARAARASGADEAARPRARRPPLGGLGVCRAARRAAAPAARRGRAPGASAAPAPDRRSVSRAALERAHRAAALDRMELGTLTPDEARELLGDSVDPAERRRPLRGERWQPLLSRAARTVARPCRSSHVRLPTSRLTGIGVPAAVVASLSEELALPVRPRAPRVRRSRRGGRSVRARAGRGRGRRRPRLRRWTPSTSSCSSTSFARPTSPGASGSATRWCDGRSTRPPPAAGGWVPTSGAPRRSRHAVRRRRRAPTTSSGRLARATSPPSPSSARPARRQRGSRLRALRGGSVRRCGCSRRPRRRRIASSSCSPAPGRWRRRASSPTATRRCCEAIAIVPERSSALRTTVATACARVERFLGRYEQAHARLVWALFAACRSRPRSSPSGC